jgi:phosphotriesterase-related protein
LTGLIRTLGADLPAELAGPTFAHEHLIIDSPLVAETMPHIHLGGVDDALAEVTTCIASGVRTMIDAMPAASGRHPDRLARISVRSGMRVIASTGLHTAKYYDSVEWTRTESPQQLADRFVADIEEGIDRYDYLGPEIDRTEVRAGVIKVATLTEDLADRDLRLFEGAAIAHRITHTEGGWGGMEQIEKLLDLGVAPDRIALSHTDKVGDESYHREMLSTGVFLCYDQALRFSPDGKANQTARLIVAMLDAGHGSQIVLGTDGARRSLWSTLGGAPGLAWLYDGFGGLLRSAGIDDDSIENLFVTNPAEFLSLGF